MAIKNIQTLFEGTILEIAFFHDGPVEIDDSGRIHEGFLTANIIKRYFSLGEEVVIATRIKKQGNGSERPAIQLENVSFEEMPNLKTLTGYLKNTKEAERKIEKTVRDADIIISRVPSSIGSIAANTAHRLRKPYILEVVGDPWESLRHHSNKGKLLAPFARKRMADVVRQAPYVIYVTDEYLQKHYPTRGKGTGISDVILPEMDHDALQRREQRIDEHQGDYILGTLGVVHIKYKGQQHVIKALAKLKEHGITNYKYMLAGPGDQTYLRETAKQYGVEDQVVFLGALPHSEALRWLESIDIYLQPSETEGMPRALIEAMSKGCCCLGSNAGGIPELLQSDDVFRIDKTTADQIAEKLKGTTQEKLKKDARINMARAMDFLPDKLADKRAAFYKEFLRCEYPDNKNAEV